MVVAWELSLKKLHDLSRGWRFGSIAKTALQMVSQSPHAETNGDRLADEKLTTDIHDSAGNFCRC
jgi:hypothetical protein